MPIRNLQTVDFAHNFLHLLRMTRKIIHKVIPHLRLMLMLLLAIPRIVRNRERSTGFEHERD